MSRSGTSAVAGMFVCAGFFAGEDADLLAPTEFNPLGHHERWRVILANERALRQTGGTWFEAPEATELRQVGERATESIADELNRIVHESDGRPIVLKDPRIDVLMPLWEPLIGSRLHPVLVIRNPVEVALSLNRRDATPLPFALAAWELHMAELLAHLVGRLVTVVPYGRLPSEPQLAERIVASVAAQIDPALAAQINPADAPRAIDPRLRHHAVSARDERVLLTTHQQELWRALASLPTGDQTLSLPAGATIASATAREIAQAETKRVWDAAQQARIIEALEGERARNALLAGELHDARRYAAEVELALQQALTSLTSTINSVSWRVTTPLRATKRGVSQLRR